MKSGRDSNLCVPTGNRTLLLIAMLFLFSCSDDVSSKWRNEVQVYSDECVFSFTLKTRGSAPYSSGRFDADCEYEKISRFYKIPRDTIYYEACAGKRKTQGEVYHDGSTTQIEIQF